MKALVVMALAISFCSNAASAHGGAAEPMPGANFSELPSYSPRPIWHCSYRHAKKCTWGNRVIHGKR